MNINKGKLELFQEKVKIKHIDLDLVMEYVNRLYLTRRVHRNFKYISKKIRDQLLFDREAYGEEGTFYWRDDLQESYYNINDRGCNPSLWMPFYIEKIDGKYYLNVRENAKGSNADSSKNWLSFLHRTIFYPTGIYSVGSFDLENVDFEQKHQLTFSKKGMNYTKIPDVVIWDPREFEEPTDTVGTRDESFNEYYKKYYYPIIFDYISKFIELNELETFNFDEKNYTWQKKDNPPKNSYIEGTKFKQEMYDAYTEGELEDYDNSMVRLCLSRILFYEEDIYEIDEYFLDSEEVGEYYELIKYIIDKNDPYELAAEYSVRRAIFNETEEDKIFQSAFYKVNEDGTYSIYDDLDTQVLEELGYSVNDEEKLLEELQFSILSSAIKYFEFKMYKCNQANGIYISDDKY